MSMLDTLRQEWKQLSVYERFEQIVARVLLLVISLVIVPSANPTAGRGRAVGDRHPRATSTEMPSAKERPPNPKIVSRPTDL
jgi:hypothetical protein